jgi:hypothetical protein
MKYKNRQLEIKLRKRRTLRALKEVWIYIYMSFILGLVLGAWTLVLFLI